MRKYYLLFLICTAGSLFAQGISLPEGMFAGLGPEVSGYTRDGYAFGAGLKLGFDFNTKDDAQSFSVGQKTQFFSDFDTVRVLELFLFFRYYLPWLHLPKKEDGPFAQVEAGAALIMEHGYHIYDEVFPFFSGGAAAGWRFNFSPFWFLEPAVRFGYPYIWGASITAGIKFKPRKSADNNEQAYIRSETESIEQVIEIREVIVEKVVEKIVEVPADSNRSTAWQVVSYENDKGAEEHILIVKDDDGRLRLQVPSIVFRANHADFTGLSAALLDGNRNSLRRIAQLLNTHKDYQILIEGHANPTTPEGERRALEEPVLMRLSEERAKRIADELVKLGVDQNRLTVNGAGCTALIVPYNEYNDTWKNRRVEFILISEQ